MATVTKFQDPESNNKAEWQIHQPFPRPQPVILVALPPPPRDYLLLSILSFFFFILLAFPALFFSLKTREANRVGDQRKALRYSRLALSFSICSILVGCTLITIPITLKSLKWNI